MKCLNMPLNSGSVAISEKVRDKFAFYKAGENLQNEPGSRVQMEALS
jgi:hypothetical protein